MLELLAAAAQCIEESATEMVRRSHDDVTCAEADRYYEVAKKLRYPGLMLVLKCSTSHISEYEMDGLQHTRAPSVISRKCGAWVRLRPEPDFDLEFGVDVACVLSVARELGCCWVNFDADGDVLPGLATFDW